MCIRDRYRAVAGLSMGGGGSFMYALRHPELFSSACPLSAYIGPLTLEQTKMQMKRQFPSGTDAQAESYFQNYNALNLLAKAKDDDVKSVKWYIDCGDDDFLYEGNSLMPVSYTHLCKACSSRAVLKINAICPV